MQDRLITDPQEVNEPIARVYCEECAPNCYLTLGAAIRARDQHGLCHGGDPLIAVTRCDRCNESCDPEHFGKPDGHCAVEWNVMAGKPEVMVLCRRCFGLDVAEELVELKEDAWPTN